MSNKIRLRIHHRGKLVETLVKWYVNGEVTEMNWSWDVGYMSYMDLEDMIKSECYVNIKCLWYWHPAYSFSRGLRPLNNDQDVLQFSKDVVGYDVIYVYVEHNVGIPQIIDDSELVAEDEVQCTGFKTADVTEEVTTVEEMVTIDPLGDAAEEENIDPNGVAEDDVTIDPNVVAEEGTTDIDEDYVISEGSFEDSEYQFSEESEECDMDWTKYFPNRL
ncbi:hypothetical protein KIW84_041421 [Lathyrus oleraceus]|uniref:PB1-like domain-containing protein n=1 Tax=Pisum sativum TaxID=3888 RepID=A0A9D5ARJ0_PEA|nr:hypothetical protein KIW84_041421 [Pisum sativum]